jgi:hypothetical protein
MLDYKFTGKLIRLQIGFLNDLLLGPIWAFWITILLFFKLAARVTCSCSILKTRFTEMVPANN